MLDPRYTIRPAIASDVDHLPAVEKAATALFAEAGMNTVAQSPVT